ncbi:unnamed protein product [Arabidopsis arenosa]|uniref:Retrotransposon gag domain-containing protein n=1 Tax=Arabidopsis arenosa TaxID=38785 RepID=A0A8S2AZ53_ARAAE|nr:unnamed protein product [Arabidopsis arenosa]
MAFANPKRVATDSREESSKLSSNPNETPPPAPSLDSRVKNVEKELLYVREALNQILRNQIYGPVEMAEIPLYYRGSSAVDHLLNIRHVSSVDEYRDRFEELTVELPHVAFDILESAFLHGLQRSLKDQVVRCRPVNLTDIVEIARLIESQI